MLACAVWVPYSATMKTKLNREQLAIPLSTANRAPGGYYCGDSPDMQALVSSGLCELLGIEPVHPASKTEAGA